MNNKLFHEFPEDAYLETIVVFASAIYNKDVFIVKSTDDYFYINEHFPVFYEEEVGAVFISQINKNLSLNLKIEKVNIDKINLLNLYFIKPIIYTTFDRRNLSEIKYYSKIKLKHFLIEINARI
ncbi:MAG: hypothetical protein M0Z72_07580 [Deltaproteobacteria bacterium]|nr:hypothetical protein [Deltaproteobacteria bacterium]